MKRHSENTAQKAAAFISTTPQKRLRLGSFCWFNECQDAERQIGAGDHSRSDNYWDGTN